MLTNAMNRRSGFNWHTGFTLVELMVCLVIIALLASVALPLSEMVRQRHQEDELRHALREIRDALDAYKRAADQGLIAKSADQSGYPKNLQILVDGVVDAKDPNGGLIYFLRRIPRDPMVSDQAISAEKTWGLRSYASPPDDPKAGKDVFDVFSTQEGEGLNGVPYRDW